MSRVIAAYDLDEDHGRLLVNADLKRMPDWMEARIMELVINVDYGGFDLSEKAKVYIASKAPEFVDGLRLKTSCIPRHHPVLVDAVKKLGSEASGYCSSLEIIEVPDGIEYGIGDYDGVEYVYELGHIWGIY